MRFVAQMVKHLPTMQETRVQSLGQEDLEKEMATHSSILPGKSHGRRSLVGYKSMGSQRVGHDWATSLSLFTFSEICEIALEEAIKCMIQIKGFCLFERILNFTDFRPPLLTPPRLNRELDSGLAESVSTLIWAAPRLQSEVAELKIVSTASFSDACSFSCC